MITLEVCIGSACYVKGSGKLAGTLSEMIERNGWKDLVELKGSFCMKSCQDHMGLGIKINGERLEGINAVNASERIEEKLKELMK